ncbi:MAG: ADP-ribosylglycohydrolase family protein [Clostridiales bacterium]|nr:ADP-ribosylglycohydrolase family protein [Clostridiales bacterium]
MYGAILGDIIGSPFEFDRGDKTKDFELFTDSCSFTDDTVMTLAVAEALMAVGKDADANEIKDAVVSSMQNWGRKYPDAGYGGRFGHWLWAKDPKPYRSYGNGSAMRVSAAGWLYDSLERTREAARATAEVTHNHPEGIKGAEATASAIFLARNGESKEAIKEYITREFNYDLNRTLDEIRPTYHMDESCQRTVPEAIIAFLEADSFEDAVRGAVSLGGDADTLGAITGSIAEAYYGIPAILIAECRARIDEGLMTDTLNHFDEALGRTGNREPWADVPDGNRPIEAAIARLYEQSSRERLEEFFDILLDRMGQNGDFLVPYMTDTPFFTDEDLERVQIGKTYHLDHDVRMKIQTLMDEQKREWIGIFTSEEEMNKGDDAPVRMNRSVTDILQIAWNQENITGVVINPFGNSFRMQRATIGALLELHRRNCAKEETKNGENN